MKQAFSWYYNQRYNRRSTLWGEWFKSLMTESGETMINCLAYIDLNPDHSVQERKGMVSRHLTEYRYQVSVNCWVRDEKSAILKK